MELPIVRRDWLPTRSQVATQASRLGFARPIALRKLKPQDPPYVPSIQEVGAGCRLDLRKAMMWLQSRKLSGYETNWPVRILPLGPVEDSPFTAEYPKLYKGWNAASTGKLDDRCIICSLLKMVYTSCTSIATAQTTLVHSA
eukprot:2389312-Amphidinium_carterae.5